MPTGRSPEQPDHPRIRGEHEHRRSGGGSVEGSSPHTRGARWSSRVRTSRTWIIPAYAGSTYDFDVWCWNSWDHPRIRGEHMSAPTPSWKTGGSSPHTRGAPPRSCGSSFRPGIIPAYAGSTRDGVFGDDAFGDHPRIRGEHHRLGCAGDFGRGSSPHTRGAPPYRGV